VSDDERNNTNKMLGEYRASEHIIMKSAKLSLEFTNG